MSAPSLDIDAKQLLLFFLLTKRKTRGVLLILDSNLADIAHQLHAADNMQLLSS